MRTSGTVMLDVISPCVTFNDHEGSTKSYKYMQGPRRAAARIGFVPVFEEIDVDYDPGTTVEVTMHDGSRLRLRKLEEDYDPTNRIEAVRRLMEAHAKGEVLTGVFYLDPKAPSFIDMLNMVDEPLATLPESMVRPCREVLEESWKSCAERVSKNNALREEGVSSESSILPMSRLAGFGKSFVSASAPAAMFRVLAGFGKIGVSRFQHRVLVAVTKLSLHGIVTGLSAIVLFQGPLESVLVFPRSYHSSAVLPA